MPQIWMTYIELGSLLTCTPHQAREQAIAIGADRKRSRDGLSRVKLPPRWMELFIDRIRNGDRLERAAQALSQLQPRRPDVQPSPPVSKSTGSEQQNQWRPFADGKAA